MDALAIEATLAEAEARVERGEGLSGSGFWRVVGRVKRNPELAERYADRIARIDDAAFRDWAWLVIPIQLGTTLALVATAAGLFLVGWSYFLVDRGADTPALVSFGLGFGVILVTTHGLGHLAVGRALGVRFTAWFVGSLTKPNPGVKIEYSSYLRSTPARRAWTHAAGAIVTKIVPFALIGAARVAGLPGWVAWALVAVGLAMVVTDVLWSTKSSDWARFRRERAIASG